MILRKGLAPLFTFTLVLLDGLVQHPAPFLKVFEFF